MDCIFCKIIKGEIPSYTIYEDEKVKVFLDINPSTNGHSLIIPKEHFVTVSEMNEKLFSHILTVEKKMYELFKKKLKCKGLSIIQNNDLGQEVKHYHIHLIPRYEKDFPKHIYNESLLIDIKNIHNKIGC